LGSGCFAAKGNHYRYRLSKLRKYPAQCPLTQTHPPQVLRRVSQHTPPAPDPKTRLNYSPPLESPISGSSHSGSHACQDYHNMEFPYPFSLMVAKAYENQSRIHRGARNTVNNRPCRLLSHTQVSNSSSSKQCLIGIQVKDVREPGNSS